MGQLNLLEASEKLVIATHNNGKLIEIQDILSSIVASDKIISSGELNLSEPEEDGLTFEENAIIKSASAAKESGYNTLADDSGLEVDVLDGEPGIYSARWAGEKKDFSVAMAKIKSEIESRGLDPEGQTARFVCVLSFSTSSGEAQVFRGTVEGKLTFPPRGEQGFGYDSIFIPNNYDITFAEMDSADKQNISHRANAFKRFLECI